MKVMDIGRMVLTETGIRSFSRNPRGKKKRPNTVTTLHTINSANLLPRKVESFTIFNRNIGS